MKYGLIVKDKELEVPLQNVTVSAQVKGYLVGLNSTLRYRNDSTGPLEVLFRFPVDESMAVVGLEAVIDGRRICAKVQEKEEAKATYDDAIASGLTAALGEESAGDVFSLSLGNLAPGTDAQLHLKLVGELPVESETGAVQFTLPSVLKPRYTPAGSKDPLAAVLGEPGQVERSEAPAVSTFQLLVWGAGDVSSVNSPTHELLIEDKDGVLEASLKEASPLNKDLVILVHHKDPHQPKAVVEDGKEGGNELMASPAVMLDFYPKFESKQAACEFVFVVDRSGSMRGQYITSAQETLILFLKSIPPGCYFNIIGFGSSYTHLFPNSVPYDQSNLDKAMEHANNMQADLGGTVLLGPLKFVFEQKLFPGLPRQVFILTDGSVSNTKSCVDKVKENAHIARVFTFGIGSGASTALVKGLARAGNGSAEFIKEGERMQSKVISSLKKALQPSVTDVGLRFDVPDGIEVQQAPTKIPPIFNGDRLVMYGVLKTKSGSTGQCKAVLSGKLLGKDIEHNIEFCIGSGEVPSSFPVPIVHHLAAKSLIKDWQSTESRETLSGVLKSDMDKSIIKLSIESGVISAHTAYVAVDEDQDKPIEGAMKTWDLTATETSRYLSGGRGGGMHMLTGSSGRGGALPRYRGLSAAPMQLQQYMYMPLSGGGGERGFSDEHCMFSLASQPKKSSIPSFGRMFRRRSSPRRSSPPSEIHAMRCRIENAAAVGPAMDITHEGGKVTTTGEAHEKSKPSSSLAAKLSHLIALQAAEGYWDLGEELAGCISQPLRKLRSKCPAAELEKLWATALAVALLRNRFSAQQDEWELVAMKAEMWMQNQTIPPPHSLDEIMQAAKQCLA